MSTPTAFISPINILVGGSSSGWSNATNVILPAQAMDGRVDTVSRGVATGGDMEVELLATATEYVRCAALINHNIPVGEFVTFTAKNGITTVATVSRTVEAVQGNGYQNNLLAIFDDAPDLGVVADTLVVTVANADGLTIDVGEFWMGGMWVPSNGINFDTALDFIDPSLQAFSAGGQGFTAARNLYREVELQFPAIPESELIETVSTGWTLRKLFGLAGARTTVLMSPVQSPQILMDTTAICGLMSSRLKAMPIARDSTSRVWRASIGVRELR